MTDKERDALRKRVQAIIEDNRPIPAPQVLELAKIVDRLLDRMPVS